MDTRANYPKKGKRFISGTSPKQNFKFKNRMETTKQFICVKCNRSFTSSHNYNQHMKAHAANDGNECVYCHKTFKALKDHIKNVHREKQFLCGFDGCDKSFGKKNGLDRHLKTHSDDFKPFQCPNCSRMFVEKIQLERHFQVHLKVEKKTKHRCLKCLKYFNRNPDLVRHSKTVHQEKSYECDLCPSRRFGTKFEVLRHFRTVHWGEKSGRRKPAPKIPMNVIMSNNTTMNQKLEENSIVKAAKEPKNIPLKSNRVAKTPMRVTLESVEPIKLMNPNLDAYSEELVEESELKEIWVEPIQLVTTQHNVIKIVQWECQRCDRKYESFRQLKLHNIRNHNWKCKLCPSGTNAITAFHRKEDFELHWMENHGQERFPDNTECSICLDLFANKSAMHTHQTKEHGLEPAKRVRKYEGMKATCELCQEELKSATSLKKHLIQVHCNRKFRKCFTCNLQFELFVDFKTHVTTHGNAFVCFICGGMPFPDEKSLKTHQVSLHYRCPEVKPWKCDLCNRTFHCKSLITRHMIKVHLFTQQRQCINQHMNTK